MRVFAPLVLVLAAGVVTSLVAAHPGHDPEAALVVEKDGERCYVRSENVWIDFYRETNDDAGGAPEGYWAAYWADERAATLTNGAVDLPLAVVWSDGTGLQSDADGDARYSDPVAWARDCRLVP